MSSQWESSLEQAEFVNRMLNDVLDVLVEADMWGSRNPAYVGKSPGKLVRMLLERIALAEAENQYLIEAIGEYAAAIAMDSSMIAVPFDVWYTKRQEAQP